MQAETFIKYVEENTLAILKEAGHPLGIIGSIYPPTNGDGIGEVVIYDQDWKYATDSVVKV